VRAVTLHCGRAHGHDVVTPAMMGAHVVQRRRAGCASRIRGSAQSAPQSRDDTQVRLAYLHRRQ